MNFNKVIIWGHKFYNNNCHTHSYEHISYYKTFRSLNYDVMWLDDNDDISNINFDNCLFVTIGGADHKIPINKTCKYIIHNPSAEKYLSISDNILVNQIFTSDVLERDVEKFYEPFYFQNKGNNGVKFKTLYHPWCSDILPHEIEFISASEMRAKRKNIVNYVGTIYYPTAPGQPTNVPELQSLAMHVELKYNSSLKVVRADGEQHKFLIRESLIAPAIQAKDHMIKQFAVSRPYKIASYGRIPCTNCENVFNILEGYAGYSQSIPDAVDKTFQFEESLSDLDYHKMLRLISEKFTYKSQVEILLKCL